MYLEIDTASRVPIYEQIMDQLRTLVRTERLRPGAPLPSVRQLAADLGINPNTVAKAYGLLGREGLLATTTRRGTSVARTAGDIVHERVGDRLDEAVDRVLDAAARLGIDHDELLKALERRGRRRDVGRSKRSST
jgi:GntR family transcriptional regulator